MQTLPHRPSHLIPTQLKTIQSRFNYAGAWEFLTVKGRQFYGEQFMLQEADIPVITRLICWMLNDGPVAKDLQVDLSKGIFLNGPVGAGKTTLMRLVNLLAVPGRGHRMRSCREVSFEFAKEGFDTIVRYSKSCYHAATNLPVTYCFDDLGLEQRVQYFGNNCQVMGEILLSRYDFYMSHGMLTHVTSNLTAEDIEGVYGVRVRSRMRGMFNLVAFGGETGDKR